MTTTADIYSELCKQTEQIPDVFEFLAQNKVSPSQLLEVLLVDQFQRWKRNQSLPVEGYRERLPDLDDQQLVELLLEEYGYLEQRGDAPSVDEFVQRFSMLSKEAVEKLRQSLTIEFEPDSMICSVASLASVASSESLETLKVEEKIGRYEVLRSIGKGAFGEVFLAHDPNLDRAVAIKVPTRKRIARAGGVDAFIHEARAVAQLDHPNIVPVYDFGTTKDSRCFVVSKYIQGNPLKVEIQNGIGNLEAAQITATLAKALHTAHRAGMVHRDVKPANVILDAKRQPHLLDFGLALQEQDTTASESLVGTPAYMSPEQARGEGHRVDGRSDIYSLAVVFYEMLCGRRPWSKTTAMDVLQQVKFGEVRPPRQTDDSIPRELERICLKALSRRLSDRYSTAKDFADELEAYLAERVESAETTIVDKSNRLQDGATSTVESTESESNKTSSDATNGSTSSRSQSSAIRIIPKGLRSFDRNDAEFFLQLVPGPRDRRGLPDSIRFWKHKLEERDADETFAVGLLYGPSGCGKSSLVKAGLLPLVDKDVATVYVEATMEGTEARILKQLRKRIDVLPASADLVSAFSNLRRNRNTKTVVVIDQFEQWLHAWHYDDSADLIQALRQCDGANVQALLMVRDDFWMAATRLLRELEVPLVEGENAAAVDLFNRRHARKVLTAYGQAYGALPERLSDLSKEEEQFVAKAVEGLAEDGKVVSVRVALFAEMFKGREWTMEVLQEVGGTEGVGVAYLDEVVGDKATPQLKVYSRGATAILQALLPEKGTNIKGNMQSIEDLVKKAGYQNRRKPFNELIDVLDHQLRLITPTEVEQTDSGDVTIRTIGKEQSYYQLTHDYLVPSLRKWLTRKQRSTVRGRARLRLSERAALWNDRKERKLLPGIFEFLQFRCLTRKKDWSSSEQKLMSSAANQNLLMVTAVALIVGSISFAAMQLFDRFTANVLRNKLYAAQINEVPRIVRELEPVRYWADQYFEEDLAHGNASKVGKHQLYALIAMSASDPKWVEKLEPYVLKTDPNELLVLRRTLFDHRADTTATVNRLWAEVKEPTEFGRLHPLNAAGVLALLDADNPGWDQITSSVARSMASARPSELKDWITIFGSVSDRLVDPLHQIVLDRENTTITQRDHAAEILSSYAHRDTNRLFELATKAEPSQFAILFPAIEKRKNEIHPLLKQRVEQRLEPSRPNSNQWPSLPLALRNKIEAAKGTVLDDLAVVHRLPPEDLKHLVTEMAAYDYRPIRIRGYRLTNRKRCVVAWERDKTPFEYEIALTAAELEEAIKERLERGFKPVDVSSFLGNDEIRFVAVWAKRDPADNSALEFEVTVNQTVEEFLKHSEQRYLDKFSPVCMHSVCDADETSRVVCLWQKEKEAANLWVIKQHDRLRMQAYKDLGQLPIDFCFVDEIRESTDNQFDFNYLAAWGRPDLSLEIWEQHHITTAESNRILREMNAEGYRLISISGIQILPELFPVFGSTWARPAISYVDRSIDAKQRACAAVALYRLGYPDTAISMLQHSAEPTDRSYLIHLFGPMQADPTALIELFFEEVDNSTRIAIAQSLGEMEGLLSADQRERVLVKLKDDYAITSHVGYRSSAEWLLRKWGYLEFIKQTNLELAKKTDVDSERNWLVTPSGITMAVFDHRPSFWVGSTMLDTFRSSRESPRFVKIDREFAVATHEVSRELFEQFLQEIPDVYGTVKSFRTKDDGPAIGLRYYDAAHFCNWLSQRDGIPQDQWCYIPNNDNKYFDGMTLAPDFIERTGYRLATEMEWEYACRAGTRATRYYGYGDELIGNYGWYADNSRERAWNRGLKKPNDFGMFDMLGNVGEWCADRFANYKEPVGLDPRLDEFTSPRQYKVEQSQNRVVRGGSYTRRKSDLRCGARERSATQFNSSQTGMRLAKTISDQD